MTAIKKFVSAADRQQESITLPLFDERSKLQKQIDNQPPLSLPSLFLKPTLTHALKACFENPGLDDKQAASLMEIDGGQFSRIMSGTAHFPTNRYGEFMDRMGNEAPLIWLAHSRGYELRRIQTEVEIELEQERAARVEVERENALLRELLTGRRNG